MRECQNRDRQKQIHNVKNVQSNKFRQQRDIKRNAAVDLRFESVEHYNSKRCKR